ncbi:MAG: phosphoglycerate mutase family protein, partial [Bacteroidota bacterium]
FLTDNFIDKNGRCIAMSDDEYRLSYYLIRHAEKQRTDPNNHDPELTKEGHERAEKWAQILQDIPLDAVYSTDYKRTISTAQPTADDQSLEIKSYNPRALFSPAFQKETAGKTVLVVGHSNTTPVFVNKIIGKEKYPHMDDGDNGSLYIVTIVGKAVTDVVLRMD